MNAFWFEHAIYVYNRAFVEVMHVYTHIPIHKYVWCLGRSLTRHFFFLGGGEEGGTGPLSDFRAACSPSFNKAGLRMRVCLCLSGVGIIFFDT